MHREGILRASRGCKRRFALPSQPLHGKGSKLPLQPRCGIGRETEPKPTRDLLLEVWCDMSSSALLPRGTALTPVMELTGPNGVQWVAYVEGVPPVRRWRLLRETVLPGRRMRFDSADESRVSSTVPAGSPFLTERRLQALVAGAKSLPPAQSEPLSGALPRRRPWGLLPAGGSAWASAWDTAAGMSRAFMLWVLSGYRPHAGLGAMVPDRPDSGTGSIRPLQRRTGLVRPNRSPNLESIRDRWRPDPGRVSTGGVRGPRSPVER
jgi:hypothetical protein